MSALVILIAIVLLVVLVRTVGNSTSRSPDYGYASVPPERLKREPAAPELGPSPEEHVDAEVAAKAQRLDASVRRQAMKEVKRRIAAQREADYKAEEARRKAAASRPDPDVRYSLVSDRETRFSLRLPDQNEIRKIIAQKRKSFSDKIRAYVRERFDGDAAQVYTAAGRIRQQYSEMINHPERRVKRETAIAYVLALKLTPPEAAELLELAGYTFSPADPSDIVVSVCLQRHIWNMLDVNQLLHDCGLKTM